MLSTLNRAHSNTRHMACLRASFRADFRTLAFSEYSRRTKKGGIVAVRDKKILLKLGPSFIDSYGMSNVVDDAG